MSTLFLTAFLYEDGCAATLPAVGASRVNVRTAKTPTLAKYLKEAREKRFGEKSYGRVTMKIRSLGIDTTKHTIRQYEKLERPPSTIMLWALSEAYDVDFRALCDLLISDITRGKVKAPALRLPVSDEATEVGQAFDRSVEPVKVLVRGALAIGERLGEPPQSPDAQANAPLETGHGNRALKRKSRKQG
jgi:transcriptional regulator with XRE-family HTH domain